MNKLQTTTFSWLLHSCKMHLLPFWAFVQSGGGGRGGEGVDGGLEACSAGNVLDFNSPNSSFQQYIGPFHSLQVRPCKSADYEDYLWKNWPISNKVWKLVWIRNWYPFQGELLCTGLQPWIVNISTFPWMGCQVHHRATTSSRSPVTGNLSTLVKGKH